jgi:Ca-activated chloride channel family protein
MGDSLRPRPAAILLILALTSTVLFSYGAAKAGAPHTGAAQAGGLQQQPTFTSGVTQVEVYATVTDAAGTAVKGLQREDFTILEDGTPQTITAFAGGDFPAAVALAIDRSFSMRGTPLTMARTAARAFIGSLGPQDRVMLISISGDVEVLAPLSTDRTAVLKALETLDAWSTTSLHDALLRSLDLLEDETGRRAIVILSDGEDRYSTALAAAVIARARRSDVLMYPIAIGRTRPPLFAELAAITGGRSFHIRNPRALAPTLQAIAEDLRSQYLLGYAPSRPWPADAQWRRITVTVNRANATVRARSGYSTK